MALLLATPGFAQGKMTYNLSTEPGSLDPAKATGVKEAHVILNVIQGLTRTDGEAKAIPAIAERWDVSADGKTYTFHLREAKWQDGSPVTAADFAYGWKRVLEPANAGEYAHQLYFVAGAREYNEGKTVDFSTVGVKATAPRTLVVTLLHPTPFFPVVLAHYSYGPVSEAWDKAHPGWASEARDYPSNGPFRMVEWKHRDRIVLKRNPGYWNAANVKLDEITMTMVTNQSTALQLWEKGNIDLLESDVPLPDIPRLKKEGKLHVQPYLGIYFACFNNSAKPFTDARVRKAFALAVERKQITEAITRAGQIPAFGVVPPGVTGDVATTGSDFRAEAGQLFHEDVAEAKHLLAEAGYPGGRGFPKVKYLYNDSEAHRTIGEALQNMWLRNLGVKVDLQVKEWKVFLEDRAHKNYQIARHGWIGDYPDAYTFLEIFRTGVGNNDAAYSNPSFDKLLSGSVETTNTAQRFAMLKQAEKTFIADDMGICPLYYYTNPELVNPRVTGLVQNAIGYLYFDSATAN